MRASELGEIMTSPIRGGTETHHQLLITHPRVCSGGRLRRALGNGGAADPPRSLPCARERGGLEGDHNPEPFAPPLPTAPPPPLTRTLPPGRSSRRGRLLSSWARSPMPAAPCTLSSRARACAGRSSGRGRTPRWPSWSSPMSPHGEIDVFGPHGEIHLPGDEPRLATVDSLPHRD